jgi:hypothetical protein
MTESVTSGLVAAIELVWESIRDRHPDVPKVVLTLGSGTLKPGQLKYGHFAAERWSMLDGDRLPELFLGGEGLKRGELGVLGTLLHEAAHGVAYVRKIKDTSRQGRYHNKRFQELGVQLGLTLECDPKIGWSVTSVPDGTARLYIAELAALKGALVAYRNNEPLAEPKRKSSNNPLSAQCGCDRRIKASKSTLDEAPILCGRCGMAFETEGDDSE